MSAAVFAVAPEATMLCVGDFVRIVGNYRTGERGEIVEMLAPSPAGSDRVAVKVWDMTSLRTFTVDFCAREVARICSSA